LIETATTKFRSANYEMLMECALKIGGTVL